MRARFVPAVATAGLLAACAGSPAWLPLASWAPFGSTCPASAGPGQPATVIGGQLRAPISLLDPTTRDAREVPVAKGEVGLGDVKGQALPGVPAVSDANGNFAVRRVVSGYAYEVVARVTTANGRTVTLRGLAEPGADGATADINIATTVLVIALLNGLSGMPGHYDVAQYQRAVELVYQHMVSEGAPDPGDPTAILARVATWTASDAELKGLIDALRQQLGAGQPPIDEVLGRIAALNHQATPGPATASPSPSPSASPGAPGSPSPATSGSPSASPVPTVVEGALVDGSPVPTPADLSPAPAGVQPSAAYPPGYLDGPLSLARFNGLAGIALAADGTVYAADANNHRIRRVDYSDPFHPLVGTIAGTGVAGSGDGNGAAALFSSPIDLALDPLGVLYVVEYRGHRVRAIDLVTPGFPVTTIAGSVQGHADGAGAAARFDHPVAIAFDPLTQKVYVAEAAGGVIRAVDTQDPAHPVTTLAGSYPSADYADGTPDVARFNSPQGLAIGPDHALYVADTGNNVIRRVLLDVNGLATKVETVAGVPPSSSFPVGGFADGPAAAARFQGPVGLAFDAHGDLLVGDSLDHRIRRITLSSPAPQVVTVLGPLVQDYDGKTAELAFPAHVAADARNTAFASDLRLGLLLRLP